MKKTKSQQTIESDSFANLKEILQTLLVDYDAQVISLIEHLINNNSGNAYQLSTWILKQLKNNKD